MNAYLSRYRIRAVQSDHQRQKARESRENAIAWLWVAFIVALVAGGAML